MCSSDLDGSYRPVANRDNDYLMDRAAQKSGRSFSGIEGIAMQDASLQESMGAIMDRSREHLTNTDNGIIMARQRLLRAAKALSDNGILPPGREPQDQQVRSAALILERTEQFQIAAREALTARPGVRQASV